MKWDFCYTISVHACFLHHKQHVQGWVNLNLDPWGASVPQLAPTHAIGPDGWK